MILILGLVGMTCCGFFFWQLGHPFFAGFFAGALVMALLLVGAMHSFQRSIL